MMAADKTWNVIVLSSSVAGNRAVQKHESLLRTIFTAKNVLVGEEIDAAIVSSA